MGLKRKAGLALELEAINKKIKETNWGFVMTFALLIFSLDFSLLE